MPPTKKRMRAIGASIGERIAVFRRAAGMTQAQLAEQLGSTGSVVSRVETGRELASMQRLIEITDVLGVELHDLIATVASKGDPREAEIAEIVAILRKRPLADAHRAAEIVRALVKS